MEYTFGLIGSGNMGGAIAHAVSQTTKAGILADHDPQRAQALAGELGFAHGTNQVVAQSSQYLFLGVKPHLMEGMLQDIRPVLAARKEPFVLVTMAAGLAIQQIRQMAGGDYPVIRIMPNTPVAVGQGVGALSRQRERLPGPGGGLPPAHGEGRGPLPAGGVPHGRGGRGVRLRPGLRLPGAGRHGRRGRGLRPGPGGTR